MPIAGVASTKDVSENYLNATNMMFVAGLMMAIAVEHCGLHHRISLNIINAIGTDHKRLMLGFMLCTMFLSMWISNTATTAMMVSINCLLSAHSYCLSSTALEFVQNFHINLLGLGEDNILISIDIDL